MNATQSLQQAAPPSVRQHSHIFDEGNPLGERNAKLAALLTLSMMVLEIGAGYYYNSMALLADGWHMSSHALALGLSAAAYVAARRLSGDSRFAFGTWKIEVLAGYTSAIFLMLVACFMVLQSVERLLSPSLIQYEQAMGVAALGLMVNLVCAWLLKDGHHHHDHDHHHHGHAEHDDLNLRSAYLHVVADAATSLLAIFALLGGMLWGFAWLDPAMGLVGAALITIWAWGLLRESARVLLDAEMDAPVTEEIREAIAQGPYQAELTDLHVWLVGKGKYACIVAVTGGMRVTPDYIRQLVGIHKELVHVTVEVNALHSASAIA
ncbi:MULTISPECIES: CDF family Co(II)/Ni(II) efflux transporter DmeF [Comamonas]|uniref:CDF family Co(II)/Ni(II) efflux transporter DmeF n=1 Tax=Comamonas TaxID=283 RepID=UPI00257F863D|nr:MULTISPECIES: CDF family Co(II)/Ni(II) efflux transporter DmeF [Comamonas]